MIRNLRIAGGMLVFFSLSLFAGLLAYTFCVGLISALIMMSGAILYFFLHARKSDRILPGFLAFSMAIGIGAGLLNMPDLYMYATLPSLLAVVMVIIALVCGIFVFLISCGLLFRARGLYSDGTIDAEFIQLSHVFDGLGSKLVEVFEPVCEKANGLITFIANLKALPAEVADLRAKVADLRAEMADLRATASAAQQKKLNALRAEGTEG